MMRKSITAAAALGLLLVTGAARADHDRGVKYAIGGALLGIALAELAHDRHGDYVYYGHSHRHDKHKHKLRRHARRHYAHDHGYRHRHVAQHYVVHHRDYRYYDDRRRRR